MKPIAFNPRTLRSAAIEGAIIQSVLLMMSCLVLDFGVTAQTSIYAAVGFWGGVVLLVVRRRYVRTSMDLFFIRFGFLPVLFIAQVLVRWIWQWRGVL
jgi:hypothetical protein